MARRRQRRRQLGVALLALWAGGCARSGFPDSARDGGGDGSVQPFSWGTIRAEVGSLVSDPDSVSSCQNYDLVFDGEGFAIVWVEVPLGSREHRLMLARMAATGGVLEPPQALGAVSGWRGAFKLFRSSEGFHLFHQRDGGADLELTSIRRGGGGWSSSTATVASSVGNPAIHATPWGYGLVYSAWTSCTPRNGAPLKGFLVNLRQLDPAGVLLSGSGGPIHCVPGGNQYLASGAWSGDHQIIVWIADRSGGSVISGAVIDAAGNLVREPGPLVGQPVSQGQWYPAIVADGSGRVVVTWAEGGAWYYRPLDGTGLPLQATAQEVPQNRGGDLWNVELALAGGGGDVSIAWPSDRSTVVSQIRVRRLRLDGVASELEGKAISGDRYSFWCPTLARGAGGYAVVYSGDVVWGRGLFFKHVQDDAL